MLTRYAGWEYIFFLNVPIGAAVMALARRVVPESRLSTSRRRYDPLGAVSVTGGLVSLVYAISQAPQVGWGSAQTVACWRRRLCFSAAFVVVEARSEAPLLPLHLFRSRTIAGANVVGFLLGASFFSFIFVGTLYMQQVLGYSALKTGVAWLAASLTSVALAGLSQMLVTKTSAKIVMAVGMALIGCGVVWASQVPVHGHFWAHLAGPFFVAGAGTAFAFIPVSIAALAGVGEGDAGVASGLLNTSQQLGGAIGVAVASTVAASRTHSLAHLGYGPAAALTGGFSAGAVGVRARRPGRRAPHVRAGPAPGAGPGSGGQHGPGGPGARARRPLRLRRPGALGPSPSPGGSPHLPGRHTFFASTTQQPIRDDKGR